MRSSLFLFFFFDGAVSSFCEGVCGRAESEIELIEDSKLLEKLKSLCGEGSREGEEGENDE